MARLPAALRCFALAVLVGTAGCSKTSADGACQDSVSEPACRDCCQQAGAKGATWVDSECACLTDP